MYPRHIASGVREALVDTPVVVLNGARQVGKSTLAQELASDTRRYLTLDDPTVLDAARSDPSGFLHGLHGALVLDKVQRVPELFLAIKAEVDRDRRPGRFLLTGSANVMLLPEIADSLVGRMEVLPLWPLSEAELAEQPAFNRVDWLWGGHPDELAYPSAGPEELHERLLAGGFPEAVERTRPRRRRAWFQNYLDGVLHRDVRDLAQLERLNEMPDLLALLAHRSGGLLNHAELARTSGLPQSTLKRYLLLLETLFLVTRVPSWERNPAKRLVKRPKAFIPDTGLLAHLTAPGAISLEEASLWLGAWTETFVLAELRKHLAFSERPLNLFHYRAHSGAEVDFLLEDASGAITGIEVKGRGTVRRADFRGLEHLKQTESRRFRRGIVLYNGVEPVPFAEDLHAVPLSMWWAPPIST